jgi:hypothetical protein
LNSPEQARKKVIKYMIKYNTIETDANAFLDKVHYQTETNKLQKIGRHFWNSGVCGEHTDDFWKDTEWRTGNGGGCLITSSEAEALLDGLSSSITDQILDGAEYEWCRLLLYDVRAIWFMLQSLTGLDATRVTLRIKPLVNACRNAWMNDEEDRRDRPKSNA